MGSKELEVLRDLDRLLFSVIDKEMDVMLTKLLKVLADKLTRLVGLQDTDKPTPEMADPAVDLVVIELDGKLLLNGSLALGTSYCDVPTVST